MKTPQRNNTRPGRKRSKLINYHESPLSKELNDSDYELTAKKEKPLDNKRFPSSIRIVIQKNIEINRMIANQGNDSELDGAVGSTITKSGRQDNNVEPTLLDATDNTKSSNEMPVATSSPRPKEHGQKVPANHQDPWSQMKNLLTTLNQELMTNVAQYNLMKPSLHPMLLLVTQILPTQLHLTVRNMLKMPRRPRIMNRTLRIVMHNCHWIITIT